MHMEPEKPRGIIIVGHSEDVSARLRIFAEQGYSVSTLNFQEAKEINLDIVEERLNVIDVKHLTIEQKEKFNEFTHKSKFHK